MALEYFLLCREQLKGVIENLNDTKDKYIKMIIATEDAPIAPVIKRHLVDNFYYHLSMLKMELEKLDKLKVQYDSFIDAECEHKYVTDLIDINPDESKTICYCNICGTTKTN